jgi:hypothetical protein
MAGMFVGREKELEQLADLFTKPGSSLVICRGRRRIGKSTLIETFGKSATRFYQFQGLSPRNGIGMYERLATQAGLPNRLLKRRRPIFNAQPTGKRAAKSTCLSIHGTVSTFVK